MRKEKEYDSPWQPQGSRAIKGSDGVWRQVSEYAERIEESFPLDNSVRHKTKRETNTKIKYRRKKL